MVKFSATPRQLIMLRTALFRPTEGANVEFFLNLQRLREPLRLQYDFTADVRARVEAVDANDAKGRQIAADEFMLSPIALELEDADAKFLVEEWDAANGKGGRNPQQGASAKVFMRSVNPSDPNSLFELADAVLSTEQLIRSIAAQLAPKKAHETPVG